jgi:hypothetical protein
MAEDAPAGTRARAVTDLSRMTRAWEEEQRRRLIVMLGSGDLADEWVHEVTQAVPSRYLDRVLGLMAEAWHQGRDRLRQEECGGGLPPPHLHACSPAECSDTCPRAEHLGYLRQITEARAAIRNLGARQ